MVSTAGGPQAVTDAGSWTHMSSTGKNDRKSGVPGLQLHAVGELGDLVEDRATLGEQLVDLPVGVHDRRVVPVAELRADLGQRQVGELAAQVHRDLTRHDQVPAAAGT